MQVAEAFDQIRETRAFDGLTIDATVLKRYQWVICIHTALPVT
jgi:hypothetical protein